MADIKSPEARSQNMAKIKSHDTKPEVWFRKRLFALGYRYRKNAGNIPGHPDIYLAKYNTAIFIHGCFWHRHNGCKYAYTPKSRIEFWSKKFQANTERDSFVKCELLGQGTKMLIIWECTVNRMMKSEQFERSVLNQVMCFLHSDEIELEI